MPSKNNDAQDTLKFRVPKQPAPDIEQTRIYRKSDIAAQEAKNRTVTSRTKPSGSQTALQQPPKTANHKSSQKSAKNRPQQEQVKTQSRQNTDTRQSRTTRPQPPQNRNIQNTDIRQSRTQRSQPAPQQKKNSKKRSNIWIPKFIRKFFKRIFIIVLAVFIIYSALAINYITKTVPIDGAGQYQNDPSTMLYSSDVKNILVIGTDARDDTARGLSDSIILISLNKKNKKIQMTSFMRDMYTQIEGYDYDKINAAYSYGGAELLRDTIEDNFRVRIDGCMTVDFTAVAYIVDAVGGVEITVSEDEAHAVNDILYSEVNGIMGDEPDSDFLPGAGTYTLSGKQALSYSRIRYIGDADFERTQRQRTVITQILSGMKKINPLKFDSNIKKALAHIGSDMSVPEMYLLSLRVPFLLTGYETEQLRIPADGTWWYDETWDGQSIIGVDFDANIQFIREKIYLIRSS